MISTVNLLRISSEIKQPIQGENILLQGIETPVILPDLIDAMEEVLSQEEDMYSVNIVNFTEDWLEFVSCIIGEGESIEEKTLISITGLLRRILVAFQEPWNLLPLDEIKASCVHRCTDIILRFRRQRNLQQDIVLEVDRAVVCIVHKLKTAIEAEETELKDTMQELLKYLEGYWVEISKILNAEDILKILLTTDRELVQYFIGILKTNVSSDKFDAVMNGLP